MVLSATCEKLRSANAITTAFSHFRDPPSLSSLVPRDSLPSRRESRFHSSVPCREATRHAPGGPACYKITRPAGRKHRRQEWTGGPGVPLRARGARATGARKEKGWGGGGASWRKEGKRETMSRFPARIASRMDARRARLINHRRLEVSRSGRNVSYRSRDSSSAVAVAR